MCSSQFLKEQRPVSCQVKKVINASYNGLWMDGYSVSFKFSQSTCFTFFTPLPSTHAHRHTEHTNTSTHQCWQHHLPQISKILWCFFFLTLSGGHSTQLISSTLGLVFFFSWSFMQVCFLHIQHIFQNWMMSPSASSFFPCFTKRRFVASCPLRCLYYLFNRILDKSIDEQ